MTEVEPVLEQVETSEDAERLRFVGSPTILFDGRDPFAGNQGAFGLTCRVYETPEETEPAIRRRFHRRSR